MPHRVFLLQDARTFDVEDGETVLEAALRQGVPLAHECQFGACGTCRIELMEGRVRYDDWPAALPPEADVGALALACQARPLSDLVISAQPAAADLPPSRRCEAVVSEVRALTPEVTHLTLELQGTEEVSYLAGQYLNLYTSDGSPRSFSMASGPRGQQIDLHVRRIPGGRFTASQLPRLRPGDALTVELPLGSFRLNREAWRPLVMVATGTGLAPIKSILESLFDDDDCPPVWLYWGMRTEADLYLDEEIRSWASRLYEFQYVPVLSRPAAGWRGRRGHVQQAVVEDLPDLSEHALYLCGSPDMIRDATGLFTAHGAQLAHLHADGFTFQFAA
jgi:CDP-4-dehydro-6-deoxyglucose reductase